MGLPFGEGGIGTSGGGVGGGGIPNPTGQLYNLPLIGSLFPNPNEERLQRQMALAARQYSGYRPEVIQARENAVRNRLAPFQGASNLLTAMSGGTQPFDATAVSSPIMGPGMKTGNQVQMNPTNLLETSLGTVPTTPEQMAARQEMNAAANPRPANWNSQWLWPGDVRGTHVSQLSPEQRGAIATAPDSSFASGYNPFTRNQTVTFGQGGISSNVSPSAYADYIGTYGAPRQQYPALNQTAFEEALNQPSVQLPQNTSSYAAGQRAAGAASSAAARRASQGAGRRR